MTRIALLVMCMGATSAFAAAPTTDELCQASWEKAERIRVGMGLRPGSKRRPNDPVIREVCEQILAIPDEELRALIQHTIEICGGDCRDLIPENQR